jgi:hypothetical protein
MATNAYSNTPLLQKLGIKDGFKIKIINEPDYYFELFTDFPQNIIIERNKDEKKDFIHYFTKEAKNLENEILQLRSEINPNGIIWISWPKKASKIKTDVTEDLIRNLALKNGLVDVKVCAVDDIWSGLKLVIPVKERVFKIAQIK